MEQTIVKVIGMHCQGCVSNVTGVLGGLNGVASVRVSLEAGEAEVEFDPVAIDRAALCAAVEDAGFDAA
jgi:copper chaperone